MRPVTCCRGGRAEPKLFCCRVLGGVNTSTPLHLLLWLHCGLLSLSCLLTGNGGRGLVPATYCDMLTKRAGTSRFWKIHRKKEHVGKKGFHTERQRPWVLSAALCCWRKASQVSSTLSDGRMYELTAAAASVWCPTNRWGKTEPNHGRPFLTTGSQSPF